MELKGAPLKACVPEDVELVVKRGRPNMLFAVSFLMTRLQHPHLDDWTLHQLLQYLRSTIELMMTLWCESLEKLTSYAVHEDTKGQS
jgi:hypothetical protein